MIHLILSLGQVMGWR